MAIVKKKAVGKHAYYYLEHSFRKDGKIEKKEKYLGKTIPKNIEDVKKQFISEIYKSKWFDEFDRIKKGFLAQKKLMPASAIEKEKESFMIRFTYDTNRIEGSTLTLRETAELLLEGIAPKAKPMRDVKEAEAHKKVFYEMLRNKKKLSMQTVLYFHKKFFENTKEDIAGKLRQHQVAISGSKFMPPLSVEVYPLLVDFFKWYNYYENKLHPIELAALVHLKLVTIHPFSDGNGRISRMIMNLVLNNHEYPLFNITYEKRAGYYIALEHAQTKNNETIFLQWFFRRYIKENKRYAEQ
ncbi:MAG: Fic family protein [Candidatus Aenigmarchaeota archaeon]|nr:Fic family protein [Candidatus Aenigmarchaeota archaeon]